MLKIGSLGIPKDPDILQNKEQKIKENRNTGPCSNLKISESQPTKVNHDR
jgi:hypothetical protein